MTVKDSKRNKKYANQDPKDLQKGKKYFDLYPSGVTFKGKAKDYSIKKLFPKKKKMKGVAATTTKEQRAQRALAALALMD